MKSFILPFKVNLKLYCRKKINLSIFLENDTIIQPSAQSKGDKGEKGEKGMKAYPGIPGRTGITVYNDYLNMI